MENNKAIDERTKEDKERMEKEAKLEIEANFPSYFDELQKTLFTGVIEPKEDINKKQKTEIKAFSILNELLQLEKSNTTNYKKTFMKLRIKVLNQLYTHSDLQNHTFDLKNYSYLIDSKNFLREDLNNH